ncbi:unnamed protein product [Oppiella nova]|uniref:Ubiquitin-like domain-containing protein n=1 Tax=Oppiella nova TaxID=334625 RepID=A0A7R9M228_9ACAR|nr:unnamed protein product [Oppiella nova]CAG2169192.1 unnamed protein product [Oppiella nova]
MASRPLSIIVSVKTLRPEVDDYWLLIPTDVQTIADLKRHVMSIEAIDCHRHQDVDLWLADGVLRDGNTSVGDILQNRDRIEMRAKSCGDKRFANRSAGDKYAIEWVFVTQISLELFPIFSCESDADSEDSRTTYTVSKCTPKTSRNGSKQTSLASGVNGSMDELFGSSVVDGRKDPDDSEPSNWTKHLVDDKYVLTVKLTSFWDNLLNPMSYPFSNSDDEYYSMIHTLGANRTVSKKSFNTSDSLYDDCMDQTLVTNRSDHSLHKRLDARQTPSNTVATDGHTFTTAPVDSSTPVANHSLNNTVTMTTTTGAPMTPPETPPEVISDTCDGRRCSTTVSCVE